MKPQNGMLVDEPMRFGLFHGPHHATNLDPTYAFQRDLMLMEHIDRLGFDEALAQQRQRSRSGRKAELARHAERAQLYQSIQSRVGDTEFVGYETTSAQAGVVAVLRDGIEYDDLEAKGDAELRTDPGAEAEVILIWLAFSRKPRPV